MFKIFRTVEVPHTVCLWLYHYTHTVHQLTRLMCRYMEVCCQLIFVQLAYSFRFMWIYFTVSFTKDIQRSLLTLLPGANINNNHRRTDWYSTLPSFFRGDKTRSLYTKCTPLQCCQVAEFTAILYEYKKPLALKNEMTDLLRIKDLWLKQKFGKSNPITKLGLWKSCLNQWGNGILNWQWDFPFRRYLT